MQSRIVPIKYYQYWLVAICFSLVLPLGLKAQDNKNKKQDTSIDLLDINNTKLIKGINKILDTNQKIIKGLFYKKANQIQAKADSVVNSAMKKGVFREVERPLPYERLLTTKYSLGRRAYQNTVSQFNYLFNAEEEFNENLQKARTDYQDDFTSLLSFYDYDLSATAKNNLDSMVYRCNANIVLHDLRSNYVDDAYLLLAKVYLFHKNFDTAGSILQFINYSFDEKENGADLLIGSNLRNTKGKFSIATAENNRLWENKNVRNESMVWQARNYFETGALNEGMSLLQLLQSDALFPKRLVPFLNEQMAYGYYLMEVNDKAAAALEMAIPNALDEAAKTRWYYLIAQLWQRAENWKKAYTWYKKANTYATNPIVGVYAKIAMITIDSKNANTPWLDLAFSLEKMTKREKYKPYTDIIYFEMAKLAIQNKAYDKATDWLIYSIKKNNNSLKQKAKAFELLASINYNIDQYTISRIAYDSIVSVLKTNPNYENIQLRKKWMSTIEKNEKIIHRQDTLQFIYDLNPDRQELYASAWQRRVQETQLVQKNLFIDKTSIAVKDDVPYNNINAALLNSYNNSSNSDFYFDNKSTVQLGKNNFIKKWGERPNVDEWRRKTSPGIAYANNKNDKPTANQYVNQNIPGLPNPMGNPLNNVNSTKEEDSLPVVLIKDAISLSSSMTEWNKAALANAQVFLLQLNDFEKALPIYLKIIKKNIDPLVTERAMLDLASQYLHDGNPATSDSLIQIVLKQFPNGFYVTKKAEAESRKYKDNVLVDNYKEAYFLTQIGNWEEFSNNMPKLNTNLRGSKWIVPYQFLKVKMYAQERKDSLAIKLLDSIIATYKSERIKDKAKNILAELKNRKTTETYLDTLKVKKLVKELPFVLVKEEPNLIISPLTPLAQSSNLTPKIISKDNPTLTIKAQTISTTSKNIVDSILATAIEFENDSTEQHYIALVTSKVSASFVKEMQNALNLLNADEFKKQNLNVTYIQFDETTYIVWIGYFGNRSNASTYINKIKPRLSKEIISFVPTKQYQLYLIGKSNIILIKSPVDLKKYERFMLDNVYKP